MLQNLIGLTVGGANASNTGLVGGGTNARQNLDSEGESFGNSLNSLSSIQPGSQASVLSPVTPTSEDSAAGLLAEPLAALKAAVDALVASLEQGGVTLPPEGSALPQGLPSLEAAVEELSGLLGGEEAVLPGSPQLARVAELVHALRSHVAELPMPVAELVSPSVLPAAVSELKQGAATLTDALPVDSIGQRSANPAAAAVAPSERIGPLLAPLAASLDTAIGDLKATLANLPAALQSAVPGDPLPASAQLSINAQSSLQTASTASNAANANVQPVDALPLTVAIENALRPVAASAAVAIAAATSAGDKTSNPAIAAVVKPEGLRLGSAASATPLQQAQIAAASDVLPLGLVPKAPTALGLALNGVPSIAANQANANLGLAVKAAIEASAAAAQNPAAQAGNAVAAANAASVSALPTPMASVFSTEVALPVLHSHWGQQLTQRIGWLSAQGIASADIQLNPPELGPMQVRIDSSENAARVVISVNNTATREALEAHLPRLRDLFADQGLDLVDVDVNSGDHTERQSDGALADSDADDAAEQRDSGDEGLVAGGASLGQADVADGQRQDGSQSEQQIVLHYALDAYA